jgi:hypothetical protein
VVLAEPIAKADEVEVAVLVTVGVQVKAEEFYRINGRRNQTRRYFDRRGIGDAAKDETELGLRKDAPPWTDHQDANARAAGGQVPAVLLGGGLRLDAREQKLTAIT